jgi:purine-binding chemotaxis protein CheW
VGSKIYGCDVRAAQEIIPMRPATRLPGAPPFVQGLINFRGVIVTVLDLGRRLDPARSLGSRGSILLVRHQGRLIGLAVDQVVDVRDVAGDLIPGGAIEGGAIRGIGRAGADDVILLDLDVLIQQVLLS